MADVYSDININFGIDISTKDLKKDLDINAVKNSIKNILQTKKMERRMLTEFGASLEQLLFEPIDETTAKRIGKIMIDELAYWEPRINVTNLLVVADEDNLRYDITLEYSIQSSNISRDSVNFSLSA